MEDDIKVDRREAVVGTHPYVSHFLIIFNDFMGS
jgi:hypothetical protein